MKRHSSREQQQSDQRPSAGPNGTSIAPPNHVGLPDMFKTQVEPLSSLKQERQVPHEAWNVVQRQQGDVIQRYPYLDGSTRYDSLIYGIYKLSGGVANGPPSYIGQTTYDRKGDRWQEHVRNDAYAPWHYTRWATPPDAVTDLKDAPYWWFPEEAPKNVTKVEITAAEQWWYEYYANDGAKLLNPQTPMLRATFLHYTDPGNYPGNYDPDNVQIKKSWKPAN